MTVSRRSRSLRGWARSLVEENSTTAPLDLVRQVVDLAAQAIAADGFGEPVAATAADGLSAPPGGWANPWLVGAVHEHAVSAEDRSARGAWYTPESVVRGLVALATPTHAPPFAVDPTCGGGAFLLAAADRFVALGDTPADALSKVAGVDIDAGAVQVTKWSLELWAAAHRVASGDLSSRVVVGDALGGYPQAWPSVALVVGNPPFATPLRTGAVPEEVVAFKQGREHLLGPYTDLAAMHLLAAVERCEPGSVVALVQPQSILAGRDTGPLRTHCEQVAPLTAMWAAREPVFDAGVRACAAVLHPGADRPTTVRLASGPDVVSEGTVTAEDPSNESAWPTYAARSLGAPTLPSSLVSAPVERLGEMISATAGFRDEYYGLVGACSEWTGASGQEPNRLLTVGSVEPLASRWGVDRCRFGGEQWLRPTIDVESLGAKVRTWTERRLTPKVVLATQSRLLEPVVDHAGTLVPATPLLALHADADDLELVAAVLLAPPVVAWAWQQWFGSALAVDALKLAARQVAQLPLPSDRKAWQRAGRIIVDNPTVSVDDGWEVSCEVAAVMNAAYGADRSVLTWWMERAKAR